MNETTDDSRCAVIGILGRPNVGKSTLLNRLVGQKISITSRKPQTTRHRILGIAQRGPAQLVFADTPGWQPQPRGQLNKLMNQQIDRALLEVDLVVMVADARAWLEEDERFAQRIAALGKPMYLVLNKIDRLDDKRALLPLMERVRAVAPWTGIVPVSALTGNNVEDLLATLAAAAPAGPHRYAEDEVTDRSERFLAAEVVREKLVRQLGAELPYSINVLIEKFEDAPDITRIDAVIWVEKPGQKAIVIGKGGARLKQVGTEARHDLERLLGRRVFLQTWVKERGRWTEDPAALTQFDPSP